MLLRESAHAVLTDEGGAILDERTGRWTHLTPSACAALLLLLAGSTEAQAASGFAERYGIGAEQAARDVRAVAHTLADRGLTADGPRDPARSRRGGRWRR
ncbi:PqqD family peptide modification chaperone [Streptomyces chrestomyceticus]|uniref:PqqD family peptide modification chaperone n=1 Tax=Streptomyces chrestomyceticus TaxID=68185 RepID=UPI0019D140B2|nr:PqqD family peptide modification chaperone [Streptomyces chrestomyceticus]